MKNKIGILSLVAIDKKIEDGDIYNGAHFGIAYPEWIRKGKELGFIKDFWCIAPFVVSDEKVKIGDKALFESDIVKIIDIELNNATVEFENGIKILIHIDKLKKILVLPKQMSKDFLEEIFDYNIENDDKVEIAWETNQCDGCVSNKPLNEFGSHIMNSYGYMDLMGCVKHKYDKPILKEDGTATIFKINTFEEEIIKKYTKNCTYESGYYSASELKEFDENAIKYGIEQFKKKLINGETI